MSFYLYSCCCVLIWVRKRPKAKLRVRALLRGATRKVNLHSRGLGGGGLGGGKTKPGHVHMQMQINSHLIQLGFWIWIRTMIRTLWNRGSVPPLKS